MPDEQNDQQQAPPEDFAAYEAWRGRAESGSDEAEEVEESSAAETADEQETAETASESETDEEAETEEQAEEEPAEEEKPEKKKGGFQRRIDRLTREKAELAAALEEARRNPAGNPKEETRQPAATDAKEPDPKDFESWEKYTAALVEHRLEQREKAKQAENERKTAEEQRKAVVAKWSEQVEKGRDEYDDFDEVVVQSRRPVTPVIQQFLIESEVGRHVAYELGKDAGTLDRINKLSPVAAIRELTRIEAKHVKAPAQQAPETKPKVTKAPPPVQPVAGKVKTAPRLDDPKLSFEQYERLRRQQLAKKR